MNPVVVVPVRVTALADIEVTTALNDCEMTSGVFVKAVGNVYEAVPNNALQ